MQGGYVWYAGRGNTVRNGTATANLSTRFEELTDDARYLQYGPDPSGAAQLPPAPLAWFGRGCYQRTRTGVVPLDLSRQLWTAGGPATAPSLLASVIRIVAGDNCFTSPNATSQLYHVLEGKGFTAADGHLVRWEAGDFLALPATQLAVHAAETDATLFWVHDEPLLRRLGVRAAEPRFRPTKYPRDRVAAALAAARRAAPVRVDVPGAGHHPGTAPPAPAASPTTVATATSPGDAVPTTAWPGVGPEPTGRIQVLLANAAQPPATGADHGLRAMAGVVPAGQRTLPHRHLSTGLILVTRAAPGCATLLGTELDDERRIRHPVQIDWEPGGVLVTPPGLWHAHVNESMEPARLVSVADAGVHDEGLGGTGEFGVQPSPAGGARAS